MSIKSKRKNNLFNDANTNEISEIFITYVYKVLPYMIDIEELDGNFPVSILNEIRDIFTHLSRSYLSSSSDMFFDNVSKAKGHLKRAVLDCYKYLCMIYDDKYKQFDRLYKNVDLSNIDNGDFLNELCNLRHEAVELTKRVRKLEINAEKIEDLYDDFEKAYNAHVAVNDLIVRSDKKLEHFKRKSSLKDKLSIAGFAIGAVGTAFGLISIILAL